MPDRLPSLILLVGFWLPPAMAGWVAARSLRNNASQRRTRTAYLMLALFVVAYAATWFAFQLDRIPPYLPGATRDPSHAPPEAVRALAIVAAALVLPVSALACVLAYRHRLRQE